MCFATWGRLGPGDSSRRGQSRRRAAAHEHHQHQHQRRRASTTTTSATSTGLGSAATVGVGKAGSAMAAGWGELICRGERGLRRGWGGRPLPSNTAASPSWISPEASGSRPGGRGESHRICGGGRQGGRGWQALVRCGRG